MSDFRAALDFIEAAEQCDSNAELEVLLARGLASFGVTHFMLVALIQDMVSGTRTPVALARGMPLEWLAHYRQRKYYNADALIHRALIQYTPFTWDDLDARQLTNTAATVFDEAVDFMRAKSGLFIPSHDARGLSGFVSLLFGEAIPSSQTHRALKLMSNYALEKSKELLGIGSMPSGAAASCPLTGRQREALSFMAQGKTDWEIGKILGISEKTANRHCESAKRQLGVTTRTHAVAVAVHNGWVTL